MADTLMPTGQLRAAGLAVLLALAALGLGACGSGGEETTVVQPPPIAPDTGGHLAKLSDRVASDLDAGDTCHAAHAADDLSAAVEDANLPASMSADVEAVTGRLVDEVNCPPPPPPPEPKKKKKNEGNEGPGGGDHGGGDHGDETGSVPPGHAKHGGMGPPGKEKLKGE
jgi:hypothetical protein